jgi:hypothetical protein
MRPIILITSCAKFRKNSYQDAIRSTWLYEWGHLIDYRFVLGRGCDDPQKDELVLAVDDDYASVPEKCNAGQRWALNSGYKNVFQADADTYIAIPRLLSSGWEAYDCIGCLVGSPSFPGGGCGYGLGPRALAALADVTPPFKWQDAPRDNEKGSDLLTGLVLSRAGIPMTHDARFWTGDGGPVLFPFWDKDVWNSGIITAHLGQCQRYEPAWVQACHRNFMENAG